MWANAPGFGARLITNYPGEGEFYNRDVESLEDYEVGQILGGN